MYCICLILNIKLIFSLCDSHGSWNQASISNALNFKVSISSHISLYLLLLHTYSIIPYGLNVRFPYFFFCFVIRLIK